MKLALRTRLAISFVITVIVTGAVATVIGVHLIGTGIIVQAQEKVRTDLNSAREIYERHVDEARTVIRLTAERYSLKDALIKKDLARAASILATVLEREHLDMLTLTDEKGVVIVRTRNPANVGDDQSKCPLLAKVLAERQPFASTEIVPKEELAKESEDLVKRACFKIMPTPMAKPTSKTEETSGMMIKAAAPLTDYEGNLLGVLYGGNLINRNYRIVDKVKETVFQGQTYMGKDIGTATIFQGDMRVSTNVLTTQGERAIGTRIAADVGEQVLEKGQPWIERAFVVKEWRITAYEPIKNTNNEIIGVLYVGILEQQFVDMEKRAVWLLLGVTIAGAAGALLLAYLLARSITNPVLQLANVSRELAKGNFDQKVETTSADEIGQLGIAFNTMIRAIKERDEKLKQHAQQVIVRSERLAMIGQLAAGVAHEINNPLAGLRTYVRLIGEELREQGVPMPPNGLGKYLPLMERETLRCSEVVRNLLNFARQTEPRPQLVDVDAVLNEALSFMEHQIILQDIKVEKLLAQVPPIFADFAQLQQAFMNIILNACEAMSAKGTLTLTTRHVQAADQVEIVVRDTGCGIPQEIIGRIFEPFFTTKKKGTGLGLSAAYGIVTQHRGTMEIESQVGAGTTFTVRLPVTRPPDQPADK